MEEFLATVTPERLRERILPEIVAERERQDGQWGGDEHDDRHSPEEWAALIAKHLGRGVYALEEDTRRSWVVVAALAVAALESADRTAAAEEWHRQRSQPPGG